MYISLISLMHSYNIIIVLVLHFYKLSSTMINILDSDSQTDDDVSRIFH